MNSRWSLDNFDIELTKTDEGVLIKAEDQLQGNLYSKLLNHESVKSISTDPFFDLETLHQLLSDYLEKKPENTSLSISDNGKLHYSCQVLFGSVVKKFEFNIQLEKQEMDVLAKLESQVKKLSFKVLKLENERNAPMNDAFQNFEKTILEKFGKLEEILARTETRMNQLEEKMAKIQPDEAKVSEWKFHLTPELQTKWKLTNDSRTASSLTNGASSILATEALPKGKTSKFSFRIGKSNWVMVGVTTEKQANKGLAYQDPAAFAYSHNGHFYISSNGTGNYSKYDEGDRVSFTCDMETGKVQVFLNDNSIGTHEISKQNLESNKFYPFLYTNCNADTGATFI